MHLGFLGEEGKKVRADVDMRPLDEHEYMWGVGDACEELVVSPSQQGWFDDVHV